MEEFLHVMKPRTKKGPSWADNDALPQPSTSRTPAAVSDQGRTNGHDSEKEENGQLGANAGGGNQSSAEQDAEPISDMDWFKQRTKAVLDETENTVERVFEQSEDEAEEEGDDDDEVGSTSYSRRTSWLTRCSRRKRGPQPIL